MGDVPTPPSPATPTTPAPHQTDAAAQGASAPCLANGHRREASIFKDTLLYRGLRVRHRTAHQLRGQAGCGAVRGDVQQKGV
eukprot:gene22168-biopygen10229